MTNVDDFLAHYGVKGMKWGVRKTVLSVKSGATNAATGINNGVRDAIRKSREKSAATKAEREANFQAARKAGYNDKQRNADYQDIGKRGVYRVEKRIANGEKIGSARFKERGASALRGFVS